MHKITVYGAVWIIEVVICDVALYFLAHCNSEFKYREEIC